MNEPTSPEQMTTEPLQTPEHVAFTTDTPAWAYILPFAVFMLGTQLEGQAVDDKGAVIGNSYAAIYCVKIFAVIVAIFFSRKALRDLKPLPGLPTIALSVILGAIVAAFWIGLDGRYPGLPESLGKRSAFDPTTLDGATKYLFMFFRGMGLVLIVPIIEELFTRNFILRYMTDPDWQKVAPWAFNSIAGTASTAFFVFAHPEWLPALLCGAIWLWLLHYLKSVSAIVISHAVANLGLGVYSLATGDWHFL
jgi:CAAX prenyl protease-like protein